MKASNPHTPWQGALPLAAALLALAAAPAALAQGPASPTAIAPPQIVTSPSGQYDPLAISRVEHFSRVYGDSVSGSGTRFVAVRDQDLAKAKTSADALKLLSPATVKVGDGVRQVEVVVDLRRPIVLHVPPGTGVRVGTVLVEGNPQQLTVDTILNVSALTVIGNDNEKQKK